MSEIRWIGIQSLIGGMFIGAEKAFGTPPLCTIDFDGIDKGNSSAYMHYMNEVRKLGLRELILDGDLLSKTKTFKKQEDTDFFNSINHDIDVVSAVPICSGLSMANANNSCEAGTKARGSEAIQNNNMIGITEFALEIIKPKAYIFENAPNFYTDAGKGIRDKLTEIGKKNGYAVTYVKTNSFKHNNPQARSRTFGIFWKGGKCPQLNRVDDPHKDIVDYLEGLSDKPYGTQDYNMFPKFNENGFIKYMKSLGPNWRDKMVEAKTNTVLTYLEKNNWPDEVLNYLSDKEKHLYEHAKSKKLAGANYMDNSPIYEGKDKICTVFGRTNKRFIHPTEDRGYTIRELLKFMGMPDDFEWPDAKNKTDWIGQNVPALTSKAWHDQIKLFVEGKLDMTDKEVDMFNNETNNVGGKPKINFGFKKVK